MGLRGPKPKSEGQHCQEIDLLKVAANNWAEFFYTLRDGMPGYVLKVEWEPVRKGDCLVAAKERPLIVEGAGPSRKARRVIVAEFVPTEKSSGQIPMAFRDDNWSVVWPVKPQRNIWERFRDAENLGEHRRAVSKIKQWWESRFPGGDQLPVPSETVLTSREQFPLLASRSLFDAKGLWLYPGSKTRKTSDDKRIEFFAKAMAGLIYGKAPATALRALTNVRFPKDHIEKLYTELISRIQTGIQGGKT